MSEEVKIGLLMFALIGIIILNARIHSPKVSYDEAVKKTTERTQENVNHFVVQNIREREDHFRDKKRKQ